MVRLSVSLSEQIESELLTWLRRSQPGDRFPSETDIASEFKVSRVTVREALASLERRGLITRRQGVGTFVRHQILQIQSRIDDSIEFSELIRTAGYTPSVLETQVRSGPPQAAVAKKLDLSGEDDALILHKIFSADNVPVISIINTIPLKLIPPKHQEAARHDPLATEPIYTFLADRCGEPVVTQIAEIRAVAASPEVALHLGCNPGTAILNIEEVGYNGQDFPVFHSQEYYNSDMIHFQLLRRPG